jgi:DNA-binding transcriptional MocR family regulator
VDVDAWAGACAERGVLVAPGCRYAFDGKSVGALRLAFAPLTPAELLRGVERMAEARAASVKG